MIYNSLKKLVKKYEILTLLYHKIVLLGYKYRIEIKDYLLRQEVKKEIEEELKYLQTNNMINSFDISVSANYFLYCIDGIIILNDSTEDKDTLRIRVGRGFNPYRNIQYFDIPSWFKTCACNLVKDQDINRYEIIEGRSIKIVRKDGT